MRSLIKKLYDRFSKRNNDYKDNMDSMCNNPINDLGNYCSLEYAYIKKDNI